MALGSEYSFETATYELTSADKEFVYEPAEDTHILLDALGSEWPKIRVGKAFYQAVKIVKTSNFD